jgi:ribosome biogenesis SPOUT family RNA methylase Rps3
VESNIILTRPAIKVRNITATIQNLTTEVIAGKVVIQGVVHKQIFLVGEDNVVHHQAEDLNFSTFVEIFGAEPGLNVEVEPSVEHIGFILVNPTLLHQKVVLEFFVKVTETRQINVQAGTGPLVRLDQIIGENTRQELLENQITLTVPAIKVTEIRAAISEITTDVIEGKVIIQGVVHKQIFFVGEDNIERHQGEDVEFSTFVEIPGAVSGMDVQVVPTVEFIDFQLLSPTLLLEKVVVEFFAKVTQSVQLNVVLGPGALLKLEEVVGENTIQFLAESTITLSRPAIKIREIIAKVVDVTTEVIEDKAIVQGFIHKQIFFISEDNVEFHQAEDVPFSTFVDIIGARPGMNVHVEPVIETIIFDLLTSTSLLQKVVLELFVKVTETVQLQVAVVSPYGPYYF